MRRLHIHISNRPLFYIGVVLVLFGIAAPSFWTVYNFGVYADLSLAPAQGEKFFILTACFRLLMLNILRGLPHYLGAFYMADALTFHWGKKEVPLLRILIIIPTILLVYQLIEQIYGIYYDFGVPAMLIIILMFVLIKIDFTMVSPLKKALMIFFLICSIQSLDLIPSLSGLPFGRGHTTADIKEMSRFMDAEMIPQLTGVLSFSLMMVISLLLIILIREENRIRLFSHQKALSDQALMEARIKMLENRTYLELEYLLHDLKTPLTSIKVGASILFDCRRRYAFLITTVRFINLSFFVCDC